jgi:two-component system, chemotaxis family, CheB/CheR fusion protein
MSNSQSQEIQVFTAGPVDDSFHRAERCMATLVHELRDPLGVVMLSLEELRERCAFDPAAGLTHQIAVDSASHMARVIDDVMELYRARSGKMSMQTQHTNVTRTVMGAVRSAHFHFASRRQKLSVLVPPRQLVIEAHPSRLQQIMTNLLINAAKCTQPGGEVTLTVQNSAGSLVMVVRDNGVGMTPSFVSQILESHWNKPSFQPNHCDGLGIGLMLVKSLVELHGGTIAVRSDGPGKGSEFTVQLPNCVLADDEQRYQHLLETARNDAQGLVDPGL